MPFISYVEPEEAPPEVKRLYEAGQNQHGLIMTIWKMVAHSPKIYRAYSQFMGAVNNPESLPKRTLELAILKVSLLNSCIYCLTHHYHGGVRAGATLEQMLALNDYEGAASLSDSEKAAIAFAAELTVAPATLTLDEEKVAVSEATQERLKEHFGEDAILELTMGVAVFNYMTRLMRFLGPDVDMELPPQELRAMMGPAA